MFQRNWIEMFVLLLVCVQYISSAPVQDTIKRPPGRIPRMQGCYYHSTHFENGDRILTNEPCLNCTCSESTLMCFLRVCPFVKPMGEECLEIKEKDECCPKIQCPEVLADKEKDCDDPDHDHPKYETPGCFLNDKYYSDGAMLPHDPRKPCEVCYCIRNMTSCIVQECELKIEGCTPVFKPGQCCPCRYNCSYNEETTTVPPGFTVQDLSEGCILSDGRFVEDGEAVNSTNPCEHCYCMRNEMVCAISECQAPGDNCRPIRPKPDQCCPDRYECPSSIGNLKSPALSVSTVFNAEGSTPHTPVKKDYSTKTSSIKGIGIKVAPYKPSHFKPIEFEGADEAVKSPESSFSTAASQVNAHQKIQDDKTIEKPSADNVNKASTSTSSLITADAEGSTIKTEEIKEIISEDHVSSTTKFDENEDTREKNTKYTTESIPISTIFDKKVHDHNTTKDIKNKFETAVPGSIIKEVKHTTPEKEKTVTEKHSYSEEIKSELTVSDNDQIVTHVSSPKNPGIKEAYPKPADIKDLAKDNIGVKKHPQTNMNKSSDSLVFGNKDVTKNNSTENVDSNLSIHEFFHQHPFIVQSFNSTQFSNKTSSHVPTDDIYNTSADRHKDHGSDTKLPISILRITGPKKNIVIPGITGTIVRPHVPVDVKSTQLGSNNTEFSEHTPTIIRVGIKGSQTGSHSIKGSQNVYPSRFRPILPVGAIPGESYRPIPTKKRPTVIVSIPGEGTCRQGKKVYQNGQLTEPTGICKTNCQCINGVIYCEDIQCSLPPFNIRSHCIQIRKPDQCCPQYQCRTAADLTTETSVSKEESTPSTDITATSTITLETSKLHTDFPDFPAKIFTTTTEEDKDAPVPSTTASVSSTIHSEKTYEADNETFAPGSAHFIEAHSVQSIPTEQTYMTSPDSKYSTDVYITSTTDSTDIFKIPTVVETESSLYFQNTTIDSELFSIQTEIPTSTSDSIDLTTSTAAGILVKTSYSGTEDTKTTISEELPLDTKAEHTSMKTVTPHSDVFREKDVTHLESTTPKVQTTENEKNSETGKISTIFSTTAPSDEPSSSASTFLLPVNETTTSSPTGTLFSLSTASHIDTSDRDFIEKHISVAKVSSTTEKTTESSQEIPSTTKQSAFTVESTYSDIDVVTENDSDQSIATTPHSVKPTSLIAGIEFSSENKESLKGFTGLLVSSESTPTVSDEASTDSEMLHTTSLETSDKSEISEILHTTEKSPMPSETTLEEIKPEADEKYSEKTLLSETTITSLKETTTIPNSGETYFTYDDVSVSTEHVSSDVEATSKYSQVTTIPFVVNNTGFPETTHLDGRMKLTSPSSIAYDFTENASTHKKDLLEFTLPHVSTDSTVANITSFFENVETSTDEEKSTYITSSTHLPEIAFENKNSLFTIFSQPTPENLIETTEYADILGVSPVTGDKVDPSEQATSTFKETLLVTPSNITDIKNTIINFTEELFSDTTVSTVGKTEKISENERNTMFVGTTSSPTTTEYYPTEKISKVPSTVYSFTEATTFETNEDSNKISISTVTATYVSGDTTDSSKDDSDFVETPIAPEPSNLMSEGTPDSSLQVSKETTLTEQNPSMETLIPSSDFDQTAKIPDVESNMEKATTTEPFIDTKTTLAEPVKLFTTQEKASTFQKDTYVISEEISTTPNDSSEIFDLDTFEDKASGHISYFPTTRSPYPVPDNADSFQNNSTSDIILKVTDLPESEDIFSDEKSQTSTIFSIPQAVTNQDSKNNISDITLVTNFTVSPISDEIKKVSEDKEADKFSVEETTKLSEFEEKDQFSGVDEATEFSTLEKLPAVLKHTSTSSEGISGGSVTPSSVYVESTVGENKTIFVEFPVSEAVPTKFSHTSHDYEDGTLTISKNVESFVPIISTTEASIKLVTTEFHDSEKLHFPPSTISPEKKISKETTEITSTKSSHMPGTFDISFLDRETTLPEVDFSTKLSEFPENTEPSITPNEVKVSTTTTSEIYAQSFSTTEKSSSYFDGVSSQGNTFVSGSSGITTSLSGEEFSSKSEEKSTALPQTITPSGQTSASTGIVSESMTTITPNDEILSNSKEPMHTLIVIDSISKLNSSSEEIGVTKDEMSSIVAETTSTHKSTETPLLTSFASETSDVTSTTVLKLTDLSQEILHTSKDSAPKNISTATATEPYDETFVTGSQLSTETSSETEYVKFTGIAETPVATDYTEKENITHFTAESITEKSPTVTLDTSVIKVTTINGDFINHNKTDPETNDSAYTTKLFESEDLETFGTNDQFASRPIYNDDSRNTSNINLNEANANNTVQLDQHPSTESITLPHVTEDIFTKITTTKSVLDIDSNKMLPVSTEIISIEFDELSTPNTNQNTIHDPVNISEILYSTTSESTDTSTSVYTTNINIITPTSAETKITYIPEALISTDVTKATTIHHDENISIQDEHFIFDSTVKPTETSPTSSTLFPESAVIDIHTKEFADSEHFNEQDSSLVSTLKETEYTASLIEKEEESFTLSPSKESLETEIPIKLETSEITEHPASKEILVQNIFTTETNDRDTNSNHSTAAAYDIPENSVFSTLSNLEEKVQDKDLSSLTTEVPNNYISDKEETPSTEQDITQSVIMSKTPEIPKTTLIYQHSDSAGFFSEYVTSTDSTVKYQNFSTIELNVEGDSNIGSSILTIETTNNFSNTFTTESSNDQGSATTLLPHISSDESLNASHSTNFLSKITESVQTTLNSTSLYITESSEKVDNFTDFTIIGDVDKSNSTIKNTLLEEGVENLKNEGTETNALLSKETSSTHPSLISESIPEFHSTDFFGNDQEFTTVNILNATTHESDLMIDPINNASSGNISDNFQDESFSTSLSPTDSKIYDSVYLTTQAEDIIQDENIFHPIIQGPENLVSHPEKSFEVSTEINLSSTDPTTLKDFTTLKADELLSTDSSLADTHFSTTSDAENFSSTISSKTTKTEGDDFKTKLPHTESVTTIDREKEFSEITNEGSDISLLSTTISYTTHEIINETVETSNERKPTIFNISDSGSSSDVQTTSAAYSTDATNATLPNTVFPLTVSENQETSSELEEIVDGRSKIKTDFILTPTASALADSTRDSGLSSTEYSEIVKKTEVNYDSTIPGINLNDSQYHTTISKEISIEEKEAVNNTMKPTSTVASSIPEYTIYTKKPEHPTDKKHSSVFSQLSTESSTSFNGALETQTSSFTKDEYLISTSENTKYDSGESTSLNQNTDLTLSTSTQDTDLLQVTSQSNLLSNQSELSDDHLDKSDEQNDEVKSTLEDNDTNKLATQEIFSDVVTQNSVYIPSTFHTVETPIYSKTPQTTIYDKNTFETNDAISSTDDEIIFNTEEPQFPVKKFITLNKTKEPLSSVSGTEDGSTTSTDTTGNTSENTLNTYDPTSKTSNQQEVSSTNDDSYEIAETEPTKAPIESFILTSTAHIINQEDISTIKDESIKHVTVVKISPEIISPESTKLLSDGAFETHIVTERQTTVDPSLLKTSIKAAEMNISDSITTVESINVEESTEKILVLQDDGKETFPPEVSHTGVVNADIADSLIKTEFPTYVTTEGSDDAESSSIIYPSGVQRKPSTNSETKYTILSTTMNNFEGKSTSFEGYTLENINATIENNVDYTTESGQETVNTTLKVQSSVEPAEISTVSEPLKIAGSEILVASKNVSRVSPLEDVSTSTTTEKILDVELETVTTMFTEKQSNLNRTAATPFDYDTDVTSTKNKLEDSSIHEHTKVTELKETTDPSEMLIKSSESYSISNTKEIQPASEQVENYNETATEKLESNKESESTQYSQAFDSMTTSKLSNQESETYFISTPSTKLHEDITSSIYNISEKNEQFESTFQVTHNDLTEKFYSTQSPESTFKYSDETSLHADIKPVIKPLSGTESITSVTIDKTTLLEDKTTAYPKIFSETQSHESSDFPSTSNIDLYDSSTSSYIDNNDPKISNKTEETTTYTQVNEESTTKKHSYQSTKSSLVEDGITETSKQAETTYKPSDMTFKYVTTTINNISHPTSETHTTMETTTLHQTESASYGLTKKVSSDLQISELTEQNFQSGYGSKDIFSVTENLHNTTDVNNEIESTTSTDSDQFEHFTDKITFEVTDITNTSQKGFDKFSANKFFTLNESKSSTDSYSASDNYASTTFETQSPNNTIYYTTEKATDSVDVIHQNITAIPPIEQIYEFTTELEGDVKSWNISASEESFTHNKPLSTRITTGSSMTEVTTINTNELFGSMQTTAEKAVDEIIYRPPSIDSLLDLSDNISIDNQSFHAVHNKTNLKLPYLPEFTELDKNYPITTNRSGIKTKYPGPSSPASTWVSYTVDEHIMKFISTLYPSSPPTTVYEIHTTGKPEGTPVGENGDVCYFDGEVYLTSEQIPQKDNCEFCFCFKGDVICLQQTCPPPIAGCYAIPIEGFCCPRFHCPVQQLWLNTSSFITTTTSSPRGKGNTKTVSQTGCEIGGQMYRLGQIVRPASNACIVCRCDYGGIMKCDPRACKPKESMIQQIVEEYTKKK